MCTFCTRSGTHIEQGLVRWLLRGSGTPRSRLTHDEIISLYAAETIGDDVQCAREGGTWFPFHLHPDFRELYYPGSESELLRQDRLNERTRLNSKKKRSKRNRIIGSVVLAACSVLFAFYSSESYIMVIPQQYRTLVHDRVFVQLEQTLAERGIESRIPELNVPDLPPRASIQESLPSLLYLGQRGLLQGTASGLKEALFAYERAVVIAPSDVDALAGLAEVYARQISIIPGRLNAMTNLMLRASALAPDAISVLRARAAVELVEGRLDEAVEILASCGEPIDQIMTAEVDFGCAVVLAELRQDTETLLMLREQYPDLLSIDMSLARVTRDTQNWGVAAELASDMTEKYPDEPTGWNIQLLVASSIGDWGQVRVAGEKLRRLSSADLEGSSAYAKVMLRIRKDPQYALEILRELIAHPYFETYPDKVQVYLDASESCIELGRWAEAQEFAEHAIDNGGVLKAGMMQSYAMLMQKKNEDAQEVVNSLDIQMPDRLTESRLHLGAARIFLFLGDQRGADVALELSLQSNNTLLDAHLERAFARIRNGDISGMVEALEDAAFSDMLLSKRQQRLGEPWMPPSRFPEFQSLFERDLRNDVRLIRHEPAIDALLVTLNQEEDAVQILESVVEQGSPMALATLAQVYVDQGDCERARPLLEKALAERPDAIVMTSMLGYCIREQNPGRAIRILGKASAQDKMSTTVLYWTALTHEALDDAPQARAYWQMYLQMAPGDLLGQRALQRLKSD
jgi:tetratricopeptide (TPR) repeat protein